MPDVCVLCKERAQSEQDFDTRAIHFKCQTCGDYWITRNLADDEPEALAAARFALAPYLRHENLQGTIPRLDSENWKQSAARYRNVSLQQKMDRILDYISSRTTEYRQVVTIPVVQDFPLLLARSYQEAFALLAETDRLGLISCDNTSGGGWSGYLTLEGWNVSQTGHQNYRPNQCFVAMWFVKDLAAIYTSVIEPSIRKCGFDPVRIDKLQYNDKVCDRILAEIRRSRFLVADFTGHRGGVYFEAGFAMGLGIPVIYTCQADHMKDAHFDTNHYNHITWTDGADLGERLTDRIQATID